MGQRQSVHPTVTNLKTVSHGLDDKLTVVTISQNQQPVAAWTMPDSKSTDATQNLSTVSEKVPQQPLPFATIPLKESEKIAVKVQSDKSKNPNQWFRWNLLWFLIFCVGFIPLPIWLYPWKCVPGYIVMMAANAWSCLVLLFCVLHATWKMIRLYVARNKTWLDKYPNIEDGKKVTHMVVMSGYKEPIEVMKSTIDSMKAQTVAKNIFVVVGLEEGTPDFDKTSAHLKETYADTFCHFMVTRHPKNQPGEIPGKCSNSNYAARQGVEKMKEMNLYDWSTCTATTCDTDNMFQPKYFEYLGYDFLRRSNRNEVVWQGPLFYNYNLDKRPFFVRVTGILRTMFMMGFLMPQNINTMSVYSMSLELLEKGGFFHPMYQMEDIINNVKRMNAIHKLVRIKMIPYGVISGPTSGETYKQEVVEWARQARRWTIGAAEVFHYFCIKFCNFQRFTGILYGIIFTHYYGFVICAMSLFNFVGMISSLVVNSVGGCDPNELFGGDYYSYIPFSGTAFSFVVFAWMFVLDAFGTRLLNVKEEMNIFRNILHWLSTPFVLLAYSCIEYYAIVEVAIYGKKVCKHGASKKKGLVNNA